MKKILLLLLLIGTHSSHALFIEPYLFSGMGTAKHPNESESPKMMTHSIGASVGFSILGPVQFGVSADYRFYNQLDEVKSPYGNRTGSRLAISPTLAVKLGPVLLKYNYQMYGDYELSNNTDSGNSITYTDVKGHTFFLSIPFSPLLRIGAFYELEKFESVITGSTESDLTTNNNELEFNKIGLYMSVFI